MSKTQNQNLKIKVYGAFCETIRFMLTLRQNLSRRLVLQSCSIQFERHRHLPDFAAFILTLLFNTLRTSV